MFHLTDKKQLNIKQMKKIIIINGPNLNLLGVREPEIYGKITFEDYFNELIKNNTDISLTYFQSNHEGFIIDKIHEIGFSHDGIIINPGALTHYSYAILDALKSVTTPSIEVHISDIKSREEFRRHSVTAAASILMIHGKGLVGYQLAINEFVKKIN